MGSTVKASPSTGSTPRPKKSPKSFIVKLKLDGKLLQQFEPVAAVKAEPELKDPSSKASSTTASNTLPIQASSPGENGSESNANTPAPSGTDDSAAMPPPTEGLTKKKSGVKRTSAQAEGLLKPRSKPGPKKRKLEDGTTENGTQTPKAPGPVVGHKLGPRANQGAINAGLRALDRSGKPCRKWSKTGFRVKSFTGSVWEIPRWEAPVRLTINGDSESSTSGGSSKENKDSSQIESEKRSNSAVDVEMSSAPSIPASSPAPVVAASA